VSVIQRRDRKEKGRTGRLYKISSALGANVGPGKMGELRALYLPGKGLLSVVPKKSE